MYINNSIYGYQGSLYGVNSYKSSLSALSGKQSNAYDFDSLYGQATKQNAINYNAANSVIKLKLGARELKNAAQALSSPLTYTKKVASSSDRESMSVSGGSKYSYSSMDDISVKIDQIAAGQKNTGAALNADKKLGTAGAGEYKFEVEMAGKQYAFSVTTKADDTQQSLQQKMADAINARGIGLNASVSKTNGESTLSVAATQTGDTAEAKFTLRDVSRSAVEKTGITNISQQAQDAKYSVNGTAKTSKTNTVDLGSGITGTLKKASDQAITVSQKADGSEAINKLETLVNTFNTMLKNAEDNGSSSLTRSLSSTSKTYAKSLANLGVNADSKGYLSLDWNKLNKAADDGSLQKNLTAFRNTNYGFTQSLSRVASKVEYNPGNFMSISLQSSESNPFAGTGLFFNMML